MKGRYLIMFLIGGILVFQSCQKDKSLTSLNSTDNNLVTNNHEQSGCLDGVEVSIENLPSQIKDYLMSNYPDLGPEEAEKFDENGIITFEIEVGSTILIFDETGNLISSQEEQGISLSDLSPEILAVIETDFPSTSPDSAYHTLFHSGASVLVVELNNGTNLVFDESGNLICSDNDDGDNDDGDNDDGDNDDGDNNDGDNNDGDNNDGDDEVGQIPTDIQDLINNLFQGMTPVEVEADTLCDNTSVLIIKLNNPDTNDSIYAYFDASANLIQTAVATDSSNLPQEVIAEISTGYPDYVLENEILKIELTNGSFNYEVELELANNDGLYVLFDSLGNVICERVDD